MGEAKNKAKWVRPTDEVLPALRAQVRFLRNSCIAYDGGDVEEAARIANAVSMLCHDGAGGPGLISQLASKRDLQFTDTAFGDRPGNMIVRSPLLGVIQRGTGATFAPRFGIYGPPPTKTRFVEWWERTKIYDNKSGVVLTRRSLTASLRNQDGGAHFDRDLTDPAYVSLSRGPSPFVHIDRSGNTQEIKDAHYAMMRAVGWELEMTLVDAGLVDGPVMTGAEALLSNQPG